jgi:hypothetical protein
MDQGRDVPLTSHDGAQMVRTKFDIKRKTGQQRVASGIFD